MLLFLNGTFTNSDIMVGVEEVEDNKEVIKEVVDKEEVNDEEEVDNEQEVDSGAGGRRRSRR